MIELDQGASRIPLSVQIPLSKLSVVSAGVEPQRPGHSLLRGREQHARGRADSQDRPAHRHSEQRISWRQSVSRSTTASMSTCPPVAIASSSASVTISMTVSRPRRVLLHHDGGSDSREHEPLGLGRESPHLAIARSAAVVIGVVLLRSGSGLLCPPMMGHQRRGSGPARLSESPTRLCSLSGQSGGAIPARVTASDLRRREPVSSTSRSRPKSTAGESKGSDSATRRSSSNRLYTR